MSDPEPPQWNPQPGPYGAPPPQPYDAPPQPYGAPPQHHAPLPQYGRPPSQSTGQQYTGEQRYGQQHGRYGNQPLSLSGGPQYSGTPQPPNKPSKAPWLLIGAVVTVLVLVAGTIAFVAARADDRADAGAPPAQPPTSRPAPTQPPATEPPPTTDPATEPSATDPSTPLPAGERRRTLKDIDVGILVYDDIYVAPAPGWRQTFRTEHSVTVARTNSPGLADIAVSPAGWPARLGVAQAVKEMIDADHLEGAEKGAVHTMPPANSNVLAQAEQTYTGRITTKDGVVFSFAGRCTTMTGVESVHNVTVTLCAVVRADLREAVLKDADRMLATLARSI